MGTGWALVHDPRVDRNASAKYLLSVREKQGMVRWFVRLSVCPFVVNLVERR